MLKHTAKVTEDNSCGLCCVCRLGQLEIGSPFKNGDFCVLDNTAFNGIRIRRIHVQNIVQRNVNRRNVSGIFSEAHISFFNKIKIGLLERSVRKDTLRIHKVNLEAQKIHYQRCKNQHDSPSCCVFAAYGPVP